MGEAGGAGAMLDEQRRVAGLIASLQAKRGRRMWPREDASLLRPHIPSQAPLSALVNGVRPTPPAFFHMLTRV